QGGLTQRRQLVVRLGRGQALRVQLDERGGPSYQRQRLRQTHLAQQQRGRGGIHPGVAPAGQSKGLQVDVVSQRELTPPLPGVVDLLSQVLVGSRQDAQGLFVLMAFVPERLEDVI